MIQINNIPEFNSNKTLPKHDSYLCLDSNYPNPACTLGIEKSKIELLLIGDSHANAQAPIIDILSKDADISGYEITQSTTIFLPDTDCIRTDKNESNKDYWIKRFRERNDLIQKQIKENHYLFVIMGGYFTMDYCSYSTKNQENSSAAFSDGLDKAVNLILATGSTPILIQDNPKLQDIDINCNLRTKNQIQSCRYDSTLHFKQTKNWNYQLLKLKKKYPKLVIIDFTDIICPDGFCYSFLNNTPLYRDNHHLTEIGSKEIGLQYLKQYGNPLKSHE